MCQKVNMILQVWRLIVILKKYFLITVHLFLFKQRLPTDASAVDNQQPPIQNYTMLIVLAERLAQILEWLKNVAGYSKSLFHPSFSTPEINSLENLCPCRGSYLYSCGISLYLFLVPLGIIETNWRVLGVTNQHQRQISHRRASSLPTADVLLPHLALANWITSKDNVSVSI